MANKPRCLNDFFRYYPAGQGERGTHTTISGKPYPGKFLIPDVFYEEFAEAVWEAVHVRGETWTLTEGHPKGGCKVVVDIDLRWKHDDYPDREEHKPWYSPEDTLKVVRCYQEIIRALYQNIEVEKLECWILQRPNGGTRHDKNHNMWKDGFHLHFPYVILSYPILHWIRTQVIKYITENNIFSDCINSVEDIVDSSVIERNQWLMLGCVKPGRDAYKLAVRVSGDGLPELAPTLTKETFMLSSIILSGESWTTQHLPKEIRDFGKRTGGAHEKINELLTHTVPCAPFSVHSDPISHNTSGTVYTTYAQALDMVHRSIEGHAELVTTNVAGELLRVTGSVTENKTTGMLGHIKEAVGPIQIIANTEQKRDTNIEFVKGLLQILSPDRVQSYRDWFLVGAALYNENVNYFEIWNDWSKKSLINYDEPACLRKWERDFPRYSGTTPVTIGTIRRMACNDNCKDYLELLDRFKENDVLFLLLREGCMSMTEQDFSKILYYLCEGEFVYSDGEWYRFHQHRWKIFPRNRCGGGYDTTILRRFIGHELENHYLAYDIYVRNRAWEATCKNNEKERDSFLELGRFTSTVIKKLKTVVMKRHIIEEAEVLFRREGFYDKLDMAHYLLGFENGVLDLLSGEFRDGLQEDHISMSVGYKYTSEVNICIRDEIMEMLVQIQPDEEVRNFLLTFFASTLIGTNKNELFVNLEGSGGNGKGVWATLQDITLGDYAGTLNNNYLVNVSNSPESHNTMLATNYKKRYLQVNEPPNTHGKRLSTNFIKELTGGDKIQLRVAHSAETKTVEPMFKLCMLFNEFPALENPYDGGFLRRFVGIHFPNRFIDGEPQHPNEYKRNPTLKEKIKTNIAWRQQYMLLLLEYLRVYQTNKELLIIPNKIKMNTKELLSMQDPIEEFVKTELLITDDKQDVILRKDLWDSFKEFMKGQKIGMKLSQFQERIMNVLPATVEFKGRYVDIDQTYLNCFLCVKWLNT